MKPKIYSLFLAVLLAACGGRNSGVQKNQQQPNYDVVQEGSASGVTSTINTPGDTAAPLTSSTITGTNVDTTTSFTLPNTVTTATTTDQSGSIASSLSQESGSLPNGYDPPRPRRPRPPAQTTTTASTSTSTSVEGAPATDTTTTAAPPPPTDTTATGTQGV